MYDEKDFTNSEEQTNLNSDLYGTNQNRTAETHYEVPARTYNTSTEIETPRWQPEPEKYGSYSGNGGNGNSPKRKKSKKSNDAKKWAIPLTIVVGLLVVAMILTLCIGPSYIKGIAAATQASTLAAVTDQPTTVAETNTVIVDNGSDGYRVVDVTGVVEDVFPAVVSITKREYVTNNYNDIYSYFFGQWGGNGSYGNDNSQKEEVESGIGSGTIIGQNDEELLILTSYHVVEDCSSLAVTFCNNVSAEGNIKAASDDTDIAVVSVPLENVDNDTLNSITIAKLSDDDAVVGEGVVVIGNAMGYGMSVTSGIVSAVNRQITIDGKTITVTQTDAAINSGNSGGCMLNAEGEIIGISEAKIIIETVEGMCYAIPVSTNSELIQSLMTAETPVEEETAEYATGAYLGIRGRDVTNDLQSSYNMSYPTGVYVSSLISGGGAEKAGILEGDIIVAMDGVDTTTMADLQSELAKHNAGDVVTVTVMRSDGRNYQEIELQVTLTDAIS